MICPPEVFHTARACRFDGVCNLCDGFVNFVADHDSDRLVKFGAQQKHMELLKRAGALEQLHVLLLRPKLNESVRVVVRYKVDEAVAEVADPVKPACARSVKDFRWAYHRCEC